VSPAGPHRIRFSAVAVGCTAFPGKCAPAALLESPRGRPSGRALRERKRSTGWIFEPIRSSMPI
jgi:hypothetical protein